MAAPYRAMAADFERDLRAAWVRDPAPVARAREAVGDLARRDQDLAAAGFRRLSQSLNTVVPPRDLQPLMQDRMCQIAYWLWERNPLAQWLIETPVDFCLGEGATVESDDPEVQACIQAFWDDPVNRLDMRLEKFIREFGLYGELCLPVAVNATDGRVRLGYIDPQEIAQVIADPDNALIKTCVVLKGRANGIPERYLKVVRPDADRASPEYELLRGVIEEERDPHLRVAYDGACLLFQTNDISNGKRGRSDLLSLIDWVDGYDRFLFDSMDAANLFNTFAWDVELEGMTEPQIQEWVAKFGALKRNQVFAHNEKVKLQAVVPDLKAMDKDSYARILRGHILGSKSFPEHWYGLAGQVNFASAKEMGLPPVKRLTRRQKEVRYVIQCLVQFQLDQAILAGRLRRSQRTEFRIQLPELSMRDQAATVAAAASLATALQTAVAEGWLKPETASRVFNALLSQLGLEIDAKEEYDPTQAAAAKDYRSADAQQATERLKAQVQRMGDGNGDNAGQPKQTTERGGQKAA